MLKKCDKILRNVFESIIRAHDDPWVRMVGDLVSEELGVDLFNGPKSRLKKRLTEVAGGGKGSGIETAVNIS